MQREMFQPPGLKVTPKEGSREPRLWFRRFVIWPEPGAAPIQDRTFGPGLNIIWSPDPVDRSVHDADEPPPGPGHGAGKTLVCRLLRYCLGEPHFAADVLRTKISSAFKDGRVGVEVVVDGKSWAIVRSIGVFGHDVVLEGGTLETAVSPETAATGMAPFVEMLAERFVTPDVAPLVANAPPVDVSQERGRVFMRDILSQRIEEDASVLDEDDAAISEDAIEWSGGIPRTMLQLFAMAGLYARSRGRQWPSVEDMSDAIAGHVDSVRRLLQPGDADAIKKVAGTSGIECDPDRRDRLLSHGILLERVTDHEVRLDLHPIAEAALASR